MNFIEYFKKGQEGRNKGLTTGLPNLDNAIHGVQKKAIYGIASPPKVGKTTFVDYSFILSPYLQSLVESNIDIEWIYFSYEIDRLQKEMKFACFFLKHDYGIMTFIHNGKEEEISSDYLSGKLLDENKQLIKVSEEIENKLKIIYRERIVPLFGEYDETGYRIKKGKIDFIENKKTPTQMFTYLQSHVKQNGRINKDEDGNVISFIPNNPNKYTIVITDHVRKITREKNSSLKETVDKWISHSVELRNLTEYSFVHIIHSNRDLANIDRIKYMGEFLYPTSDDIKDTGNLSEEADYMLTLFNALDEKYNIKKHFGLELYNFDGALKYPNYRSLHLVESRQTVCPQHMQIEIKPNLNILRKLIKV